MLVWRHILSDLQKGLIKEVGMSYIIIIRNFTIFIALAGIEDISIADEKEQSAIKELFKLKIGTKKEDLIFYRFKSTD
jgi:hypothetical protein